MKPSEVLEWAMRGVIETMKQERDLDKQKELDKTLKELARMFVLAEQKHRG